MKKRLYHLLQLNMPCELKIKPYLFLMKLCRSTVNQVQSSSLPRISRLSCFEYTQFIVLYVAIAAFSLLLHSVILWALKLIERNIKTYLSWSKTQCEFHQGRQNEIHLWKKCKLSSSLTFSLISHWPEKCGKPLAAAFSRCFLNFLLPPSTSTSSENFSLEYILARK